MATLPLLILGYLCGAIPFGLLVGKLKGVDVRTRGSGNIGATNVGRVLGRPFGYLVFVLDLAKGFFPAMLAGVVVKRALAGGAEPSSSYLVWVGVAAATVVGHMFPVYLRFKGGKGVATSVGVLLGVYPFFTVPAFIVLGIWVLLALTTHYVSVASIGGAVAFPIVFALFVHQHPEWGTRSELWPFYLMCIVVAVMIVLRHRANLRRLIAGSEPRIGGGSGRGDVAHL